ncbi:hypothetical protein AVEN_78233-1 [Araneus ventricosus]|uniref:Uncharacterized protein n=1 Tax=Araneus ventricosus TaxID=182803 RepID=A0A4Y2LKE1_ARAVE|nr:hypothetical protein AVEN_78233-1 [Araneus ventricosus]
MYGQRQVPIPHSEHGARFNPKGDRRKLSCYGRELKESSRVSQGETRIRSLDSLGLTKDKYADILSSLIESTLPIDIVKMWDRQRHLVQDTQGKSDLDLLMDFVKNEVDSEFRVKISREIFNTGKITNKKV